MKYQITITVSTLSRLSSSEQKRILDAIETLLYEKLMIMKEILLRKISDED